MTGYIPDKWVVIRMKHKDEVIYKVLGCWAETYLYGSSWRLNSGIEKCEWDDENERYLFYGHSGSIYSCSKHNYGMHIAGYAIWNQMVETYPNNVEMLEDKEDWTKMEWK